MIILNSQSFIDILKYIGEILKKAWKWFIIQNFLYLTLLGITVILGICYPELKNFFVFSDPAFMTKYRFMYFTLIIPTLIISFIADWIKFSFPDKIIIPAGGSASEKRKFILAAILVEAIYLYICYTNKNLSLLPYFRTAPLPALNIFLFIQTSVISLYMMKFKRNYWMSEKAYDLLTFTIIYILIYFISNSSPAWLI